MDDILNKHLFQPEKPEKIISSATIVIDTNLLLSGYQYRQITFKEIIDTLTKINKKQRLKIPSHVLKEFFNARPQIILDLILSVQQHRDNLSKPKSLEIIDKVIPNQEFTKSHKEIMEVEGLIKKNIKDLNENLKQYRNLHADLIEEFKNYFNEDPILDKYKKLFIDAYYKPEGMVSEEKLIKEFNEVRIKNKMPPGYEDGSKKNDNNSGDFIIWSHILEIKNDVIFVTGDNKSDWVYSEPATGNVINARRELVEEFYKASGGKTFSIVTPKSFIEIFNKDVDSEVIKDLDKRKRNYSVHSSATSSEKMRIINEAMNKFDNNSNSDTSNKNYERFLMKLNLLSGLKYVEGTNDILDSALERIKEKPDLYESVINKANDIATDIKISDRDKHLEYSLIARWALNRFYD